MSETNNESVQPRDLGALATSLPRKAVELLGAENILAITEYQKKASNLLEFSKLPNPLEANPGQTESLLTADEISAIEAMDLIEAQRGDDGDKSVIDTTRLAAPILTRGVMRHNNLMADQFRNAYDMFKAIIRQNEGLELHDTDTVSQVLPRQYAMLEEIAQDLFTMTTVKDFEKLIDAEAMALRFDAKAVTIQKHPEIGEKLRQIWAESLKRGLPKSVAEAKFEEYFNLSNAAEDKSYGNWRVRRAHRSRRDILIYQKAAEKFPRTHRILRNRGAIIHGDISKNAVRAAFYPAKDMWVTLQSTEQEFANRTYGNEQLVHQLSTDSELRQAAVLAEIFLAERAESAEAMLRATNAKFNPDMRRRLHMMKEGAIRSLVKKLGRPAVSAEVSILEEVIADPAFRRACRDARDILVGGGRIDHPEAKKLSNALHRLRLGHNGSISLDPSESGMVVGIVAGKIGSLINVVNRFEAQEPDEQVRKLRRDLEEQYKIIAGFDIDTAINNLKAILDDMHERQALLGNLPDAHNEQLVADTIERLWRQRNLVQEPEQDSESESAVDEPQSEPAAEPEQTEEELEIISEEMSNIAELLDWVVFPAGTTEGDIRRVLGENSVDLSRVNWERIRHLIHLANTYEGRIYRSQEEKKLGTNVPYLVAEFSIQDHNFAVAECPEIGNATYVVDEAIAAGAWPELMALSKADARHLGARRIIHPKEEGHLNKIIRTINGMLVVRTTSR